MNFSDVPDINSLYRRFEEIHNTENSLIIKAELTDSPCKFDVIKFFPKQFNWERELLFYLTLGNNNPHVMIVQQKFILNFMKIWGLSFIYAPTLIETEVLDIEMLLKNLLNVNYKYSFLTQK